MRAAFVPVTVTVFSDARSTLNLCNNCEGVKCDQCGEQTSDSRLRTIQDCMLPELESQHFPYNDNPIARHGVSPPYRLAGVGDHSPQNLGTG